MKISQRVSSGNKHDVVTGFKHLLSSSPVENEVAQLGQVVGIRLLERLDSAEQRHFPQGW